MPFALEKARLDLSPRSCFGWALARTRVQATTKTQCDVSSRATIGAQGRAFHRLECVGALYKIGESIMMRLNRTLAAGLRRTVENPFVAMALALLLVLPGCGKSGAANEKDTEEDTSAETGSEEEEEEEESEDESEEEESEEESEEEESEEEEEEGESTTGEGSDTETTTDTETDTSSGDAGSSTSGAGGGIPSLDMGGILSSLLGGGGTGT